MTERIEIRGLGAGSAGGETSSPRSAGSSPEPTPASAQEAAGGQAAGNAGQRATPPPRRPRAERPHAFDLKSWLLEGALGLAEELNHNDLGLPKAFWVHAYAARREALLAACALLNAALDRWDGEAPTAPGKQGRQRGRVDIDFG